MSTPADDAVDGHFVRTERHDGARWYYSTSPRYDAGALPPGTALAEGFATRGDGLVDH